MIHGLVLIICLAAAPTESPVADGADGAAGKLPTEREFPWFDAKKQAFRPLKPPKESADESPRADTTERATGNGMSLVARICLCAVLVVIVGWLAYLFYVSLDVTAPEVEVESVAPTLDPARLEALPAAVRNITDFLGEAQRLAQEGNFNAAMVFFYSWQLVTLNQAGALELEVGKTNGQYVRETTQNRPELRELFLQSTRLFEEAFFGGVTLEREDFLRLWQSREEFRKRPPTAGRHR